jgi:tetratricopeptide (TPR) repeat protein
VVQFLRRQRCNPGLTLNLSKSTASLSLGPRGAKYTISPRGNRATAGIPGTGLFYTVREPGSGRARGGPERVTSQADDRLTLGFLQRLVTPAEEQRLVDWLRALHGGDQDRALELLEGSVELADAAWMAGMLRLRLGDFDQARGHLQDALSRLSQLGTHFERFGLNAEISLPITPEVMAHIGPCERGTRLALVEIAQAGRDRDGAFEHLERLLELDADDSVVVLSFAELALDTPDDRALLRPVITISRDIENETPVDTAILFYRARAMSALGLSDAAIDVFTLALRRRKDRPDTLMRQIRYERAVLYDLAGRQAQARRELERVYAEDPAFEDVGQRLGVGE